VPRDSAQGFGIDVENLMQRELKESAPGAPGFPAVYFWYRSSPMTFRSEDGNVNLSNPAVVVPGMATIILGPDGRLLEFLAAPSADVVVSAGSPDWEAAVRRAGLDPGRFREESAAGLPPVVCDANRAWSEESESGGSNALRIRAGALGDRLTYFSVLPPWRESLLANHSRSRAHGRLSHGLYDGLFIIVILACIVVARRNLRLGRGDKRGATRLAAYVFGVTLAFGLLLAHHVPDAEGERYILAGCLGQALFTAVFLCWVPYVALEPSLRRVWPHRIVSWTRLLAGRFRDPLVGRDLMIGVLTAVATQLLLRVYALAPAWLGLVAPQPDAFWTETLQGFRYALGAFLRLQPQSVFFGLGLLFLLLGFRAFTRRLWIAAPLLVVLATLAWHPEVSMLHPEIGLTITALRIGAFVFVMLRFGVLAGIVALFFDGVLTVFPLTLDLSVWYVESSLLAGVTAIATAAWGLRHAFAGRFAVPVSRKRG
jgi:serine/threonine-protein kinase